MAIDKLIEHLNKHKDAVVIVGSEITKDLFEDLDKEIFESKANKKSLRRNKEEFWQYFKEKLYINPKESELNKAQESILLLSDLNLVSRVYSQGIDGILTRELGNKGIDFKGAVNKFKCQKSKCEGLIGDFDFQGEIPKCPICDFDMRPTMLLFEENYIDELYDLIRQDIIDTHTLIVAGLDISEQIFLDLIADYGDTKAINAEDPENSKMLVVLHDKDLEFDFNEVTFCEFLVKDDVGEALKRLEKAVKSS